uniref:Fucolectin tachylectin-4 pentraxin-1 domain-containing protein n=1 Tax=Leptobrachium leishanense TaxID=445787 RepID=A0A8C5QRX4_9ANUR
MTSLLALGLLSLLGALNGRSAAEFTENVALQGLAFQSSSLLGEGEAFRSIDGDLKGSCSVTVYGYQPWWSVDLRRSYVISNVTITSQAGDAATKMQVPWVDIYVGDSMEGYGVKNTRCDSITSMAAGETRSFACGGIIGRYVTLIVPSRYDALAVCEVQVAAVYIPGVCRHGAHESDSIDLVSEGDRPMNSRSVTMCFPVTERQLGVMIHGVSGSDESQQDKAQIIDQVLLRIKSDIPTLKWSPEHRLESEIQTCIPLTSPTQEHAAATADQLQDSENVVE